MLLSQEVRQPDQPSCGRSETTCAEVELAQALSVLEVDVQPLTPGSCSLLRGEADDGRPQSPTLVIGADLRVEQEGVDFSSQATLVKPTSSPAVGSRAVTQPKLCGRICYHQPGAGAPL